MSLRVHGTFRCVATDNPFGGIKGPVLSMTCQAGKQFGTLGDCCGDTMLEKPSDSKTRGSVVGGLRVPITCCTWVGLLPRSSVVNGVNIGPRPMSSLTMNTHGTRSVPRPILAVGHFDSTVVDFFLSVHPIYTCIFNTILPKGHVT